MPLSFYACVVVLLTITVVLAYCCLIISAREDEWWEEQEKDNCEEVTQSNAEQVIDKPDGKLPIQ